MAPANDLRKRIGVALGLPMLCISLGACISYEEQEMFCQEADPDGSCRTKEQVAFSVDNKCDQPPKPAQEGPVQTSYGGKTQCCYLVKKEQALSDNILCASGRPLFVQNVHRIAALHRGSPLYLIA